MATIKTYTLNDGTKKYEFWAYLGRDSGTGKAHQKHQRGFKTYDDAKKAAMQWEMKALDNDRVYSPSKHFTIAEYLDIWINELKTDVKEGTLIIHRYNIKKYIVPYVGQYRIDKYRYRDHQKFITSLFTLKGSGKSGEGLSYATVKSINATLSSAFRKAKQLDYIENDPTKNVEFPRKYQPDPTKKTLHYWSVAEENRFFSYLVNDTGDRFWYLFFLLIFDEGLQVGETMALKWSDLNVKTGMLSVNKERLYRAEKRGEVALDDTKTAAGMRELPMTKRVIEATKELYDANYPSDDNVIPMVDKHGDDFVFRYANRNRSVVRPRAVTTTFNRVIKAAGLPHIRIHDGRHTNAIRLREAGVSLDDIQDMLGHKDPSTTRIYAEVTPKIKQKAIESLENYLNENN